MAGPISCVPPGLDVTLLTGPLVLGYMFSYGLFGILVVQMLFYHVSFPKDHIWMKATVWALFFFECLSTIFATISAWNGLGAGWGNPSTLDTLDWSFDPLPALSGLLASMAQGFFCWRIYKLTSIIWLPMLIAGVSLTQWIMAFYTGVKVGIDHRSVAELFRLSDFVIVWLVGSALCDVLITVSMVTILLRAASTSGFKRTSSTLLSLIKYTVETGMVTSLGAILEIILFLLFRTNNLHFILFLMLSKLYSNTLMATLNSRMMLRTSGAPSSQSSAQASTALWRDDGPRPRIVPPRIPLNGVHISTRTEMRGDDIEMASSTDGARDSDLYTSKKDFTV